MAGGSRWHTGSVGERGGEVEKGKPERTGPPSAAARNTVIALLLLFQIGSWVGDLLLSFLIPDHPLILLAINDRFRNYPLVVPHTDALAYYVVGTLRLAAPYPLFFLLGRWYGDGAVRWMERGTPALGSLMRFAERCFDKAAVPLVALVHVNMVAVFAGASRMSMRRFLVVKVLGSFVLLAVVRAASTLVEDLMVSVGDWIASHRLFMVVVAAVAIAVTLLLQRRSSGETEIESLVHLEEEIHDIERESEPSSGTPTGTTTAGEPPERSGDGTVSERRHPRA